MRVRARAYATTRPLVSSAGLASEQQQRRWLRHRRARIETRIAGSGTTRLTEGYGTTGHNGHFSAAYDAVVDPNNDPLILFDQRVGPSTIDVGTFIVELRRDFYPRASRADDSTLDLQYGGTIVTGNYSGPYWGWLQAEGRFHGNATSQI